MSEPTPGSPPETDDNAGGDLYRIGTVAQLTGISVERLRAWERRYGLVPAHRAGKTRFYSSAQLERLAKIKRLIDAGQPISSLVELSDSQLDERLTTPAAMPGQPARTGLIGPNLLVLEQQQTDVRIQIEARWANMDAFERDQLGVDELDAIVVQLPVLKEEPLEIIQSYFPEAQLLVLYQFATQGALSALADRGVPGFQWPTPWDEIENAVASVHRQADRAGNAAGRRFSDEELVAIAASTLSDPTGLPQHLVELISRLNALADYTRELPGYDAELAQSLHVDATQGRAHLERALEALAMAEGLIATPEPQKADMASAPSILGEQNLYKK